MLWVRSQDNYRLVSVTGVSCKNLANYSYEINGWEASCAGLANIYWSLGKYSSEEKAIKVLDMLEMVIKGSREYSIVPNGYPVIKDRVFQMPADEEVEVD